MDTVVKPGVDGTRYTGLYNSLPSFKQKTRRRLQKRRMMKVGYSGTKSTRGRRRAVKTYGRVSAYTRRRSHVKYGRKK